MEPSKSIRTTWSIRVFMSPSTVCTVSGAPPRYRGIGQYACQVIDLQSQLESEPAPLGVRYRLAWGRMTTARIGPQAGPGAFGQPPAWRGGRGRGHRRCGLKGQVQRGVCPVDVAFENLADRLA